MKWPNGSSQHAVASLFAKHAEAEEEKKEEEEGVNYWDKCETWANTQRVRRQQRQTVGSSRVAGVECNHQRYSSSKHYREETKALVFPRTAAFSAPTGYKVVSRKLNREWKPKAVNSSWISLSSRKSGTHMFQRWCISMCTVFIFHLLNTENDSDRFLQKIMCLPNDEMRQFSLNVAPKQVVHQNNAW